jgi:prepilin-type N-terminal cleavage/methylation domain-containing protein
MRKGFTLVETLIGLVILLIALFSISALVFSTTKLMTKTIEREKAFLVAMEQVGNTRNDKLRRDNQRYGNSGDFILSWAVTTSQNSKGVRLSVARTGAVKDESVILERSYSPFSSNKKLY